MLKYNKIVYYIIVLQKLLFLGRKVPLGQRPFSGRTFCLLTGAVAPFGCGNLPLYVFMLSKVYSGAVFGLNGYRVEVEVDISPGNLASYQTVGLPDASVKESQSRVKAAIINSGFRFPFVKRITVNLAPADIKKEGSAFDLPIAIAILNAMGILKNDRLKTHMLLGELSLDGRIKPIKGALPIAVMARSLGVEGILLPVDNASEAAVVSEINIYPVESLPQAVEFLTGNIEIKPSVINIKKHSYENSNHHIDFADVKGQQHVKRSLEIACAGGHNIIMIGPPGSGKSMLAKRLPSILPLMFFEESLETTKIHSIMGLLKSGNGLITTRPFRSPHHTISDAGLIGGGHIPMPGEVSLTHNGVLFLDELPEFKRNVLEVMRQPLEDGYVTISRAATSLTYPASFMLVAAMNPCPCGYKTDPKRECGCAPIQIKKYVSRISGPLLDRIDIHIEVPALKYQELSSNHAGEKSESIRKRVQKARDIQLHRFSHDKIYSNAKMTTRLLKKYCKVDNGSEKIMEMAINKLGLSARAYDRILKVSRTIADLAGEENIQQDHISEAIQYRTLDRENWF